MFKWAGKEALEGAVEKVPDVMPKLWKGLELGIQKTPLIRILPYFYKAFDSMSEEEKTEFLKNAMIAGAKLGAKL